MILNHGNAIFKRIDEVYLHNYARIRDSGGAMCAPGFNKVNCEAGKKVPVYALNQHPSLAIGDTAYFKKMNIFFE